MIRRLLALSAVLLSLSSAALAAEAQMPLVKNSAGVQVEAGAVVPVASDGSALASTLPLTVVTNSATGTTLATVATLPAAAALTTYICGFSVTADATAAVDGAATLVGLLGGTMTFRQNVGVATAAQELREQFTPCLPASAANTALVVTSVAAGTGGHTNVSAWGYQQ